MLLFQRFPFSAEIAIFEKISKSSQLIVATKNCAI